MKIVAALFDYFPHGGLQRDFKHIVTEAALRGHELHVVAGSINTVTDNTATEIATPDSRPNEHEWLSSCIVHDLRIKARTNHQRAHLIGAAVIEQCKSIRPDCVIGFNKMPGLDFYYAADSCFRYQQHHKHGKWLDWTARFKCYAELEAAVFDRSETNIFFLNQQQKSLYDCYYSILPERTVYLKPGINRDRCYSQENVQRAAELKKQLSLDKQKILLALGSGFRIKGLDRTLHAIAALPESIKNDVILLVVGNDKAAPFIALAKKLGLLEQVKFLGGRDDVPALLHLAHCVLHPAYRESAGHVLLEATVAGTPIITTDTCGYASYIEQANSGVVLASPFAQEQYNQTLHRLLMQDNVTQDNAAYRANGIAFGLSQDLYDMPVQVVDEIEARA